MKRNLLRFFLLLLISKPLFSQFIATPPVQDGVINAFEYGNHTIGQNRGGDGDRWYMTWDDTNLYVGIINANRTEASVVYIASNPSTPINAGTNADGTNVGQEYDNTNFAELQFRADIVLYVKNSYREFRTADGVNGWSSPTTPFGNYGDNGSDVREFSLPWAAIGGRPSSFAWFGYVTSPGGIVFGEVPSQIADGTIGLSARWGFYQTINNTNDGVSIAPFSRASYVFTLNTDIATFNAITVYDFTMNTPGRSITRGTGNWVINGGLIINQGTINFGSTTSSCTISGNLIVNSAGALNLSSAVGGDLTLQGNLTVSGGTFNTNGRAVFFTGSATQTIGSSPLISMAFVFINKPSGNVVLEPSTNLNVTGSGANSFEISNIGGFDLNGNTLTFSNGPGNIRASGAAGVRYIVGGSGSEIVISGTRSLTSTGGVSWSFGSNVALTVSETGFLEVSATVELGQNPTVNGTFRLLGTPVITGITAFNYGPNSTLSFSSITGYTVNSSDIYWPQVNGPRNVEIGAGSTGFLLNDSRTMNGTLTFFVPFTIATGVDLNINGTLAMRTSTGPTIDGSLTYGLSSSLIFNGFSTITAAEAVKVWPTSSNRPRNVTIIATEVQANGQTVDGLLTVSNVLRINSTLNVNDTLRINTGGSIATNSPTYNLGTSTLHYNTGTVYGRNLEWGTTNPHNVRLSNNTVLDLGANGGTTTARTITGNLTIDSGSLLEMAGSFPMTASLTVLGNVAISGQLTLSNLVGGDLRTEGNLTVNSGGLFTTNSRALFLDGTNNQTLTASGTLNLDYFFINKTDGTVSLGSPLSVNATVGTVLSISPGTRLDLGSHNFTLANDGGNLSNDSGTEPILGSATTTGRVIIAGNKTLNGAASFRFEADVQINSGKTLTLGSSSIIFERGLTGSGALVGNPAQSIFISNASGFDVPFGTLRLETVTEIKDLEITRPSHTILLGQNITVNGQMTLNNGLFDLNGNNIDFGTTGTYFQPSLPVGALINSRIDILAYLQSQGDLDNVGNVGPGFLGLSISTPDNLGTTTVRWYPSSRRVGSGSIRRFYSIQPTNGGTLTLIRQLFVSSSSTFDELEGNDPNLLEFYSSNDINFTTSVSHPFTIPNPFFRETDDDILLTGGSPTFFTLAPAPYTDVTVQDGDWEDPNTWNNSQVPPANASLTLNHRVNAYSLAYYVGDLTINDGGFLDLGNTSTLFLKNGFSLINNGSDTARIIPQNRDIQSYPRVVMNGSTTLDGIFELSIAEVKGLLSIPASSHLKVLDTLVLVRTGNVSRAGTISFNGIPDNLSEKAGIRYEGFGGDTRTVGQEWVPGSQVIPFDQVSFEYPNYIHTLQTGGFGTFQLRLPATSEYSIRGGFQIEANTEFFLEPSFVNKLNIAPYANGFSELRVNGALTVNNRTLFINRAGAYFYSDNEVALGRLHLLEASIYLETPTLRLTTPGQTIYTRDTTVSSVNYGGESDFFLRGNSLVLVGNGGIHALQSTSATSLRFQSGTSSTGIVRFDGIGTIRTSNPPAPNNDIIFENTTELQLEDALNLTPGDSVFIEGRLRLLPGSFVSGDSLRFRGENTELIYATDGGAYGIGREWPANNRPRVVSVGSVGITNLNSNRALRRLNLLGNVTSTAGSPTLFADSIYANATQFLRTGTGFNITVPDSGFFQSSRTDGLNGHAGSGVTLSFGTLSDFVFNPTANGNFNAGTLFPSQVRNLTINHQGSEGSNTITLNDPILLRDTLRLENGVLALNDNLELGLISSSFIQENGRFTGAFSSGYFRRIVQTGGITPITQTLPVYGLLDQVLHNNGGTLELDVFGFTRLETPRLHLNGKLALIGTASSLWLTNTDPTSLTRTGNGWIIGNSAFPTTFKFVREFDGTSGTYIYPVGTALYYKGIELEYQDFLTGPGATVEVTYVDSPPGYGGLGFFDNGVQIENVAPHYWIIQHFNCELDRGTLRINNQGVDGIGNVPLLRLANSSDGGTTWQSVTGSSFSYSNSVNNAFSPPLYTVSISDVSVLSSRPTFTYGGNWSDNPLPVELAEFTATSKESGIQLKWRTSAEINSHGFTISRKRVSETEWKAIASYRTASGLKAKNSSNGAAYQFIDESDMAKGEVFEYRLEETGFDGKHELLKTISIESRFDNQVREFALSQNYPNPFNPTTTIRYDLKERADVTLEVYNLLGQRVSILANGNQARGRYQVNLNAISLSSGVYFYRLSARGQNETFTQVKKMMLLK